jgi:hypothetical protein
MTINILANGKRPQFLGERKTPSIFWKKKDNKNILAKEK